MSDDAPKNRNHNKLILPISEFNSIQIQFIKGEIWPQKFIDKMKLLDANPLLFLMGWVVFVFGVVVGTKTGDIFYGIIMLFLGMFFIFSEILASIQASCVLSNYQMMYYSGLLELPEIEEAKK